MIDDPYFYRPPSWDIQEQLDKINRTLSPTYLDVVDSFDAVARLQSTLDSIGGVSKVSTVLSTVSQTSQVWQDMLNQHTSLSAAAGVLGDNLNDGGMRTYLKSVGALDQPGQTALNFDNVHSSWLSKNTTLSASFEAIQSHLGATFDDLAHKRMWMDQLACGINFESIQSTIGLPGSTALELEKQFGNVLQSYNLLTDSFQSLSDIVNLPAFTLPGAAREVLVTAHVLKTYDAADDETQEGDAIDVEFVEVVKNETSSCVALLNNVHPDLALPYLGAREAFQGNNPDKARHVMTSLRELWGNLLRYLAPDNLVVKWATDKDSRLLNDGKPTRNARVLYVCREVASDPLIEFVSFDAKAFVKMFEFFNSLHKLKHNLTDKDLRLLLLRTDSWIVYLLQIENEFN